MPDEIVERFCILGSAQEHVERLEALRDLGVTQFAGYLQHDNKEETMRVVRRARHPRAGDPGRGHRMTDLADHARAGAHRAGARPRRASGRRRADGSLVGVLAVLLLAALWELVKVVVPDAGGHLGEASVLPRTDDLAMPHVWDDRATGCSSRRRRPPARRRC